MILVDWTEEEIAKYANVKKFMYPSVVTLSQINSMICQRLVYVGTVGASDD